MNVEDIIQILVFIISIMCFIQSLSIEIIHINQEILRKGYFQVVFLIVTFECILYSSLVLEIISLFYDLSNKIVCFIFEILFFFSNLEIISYNILTLIYLMRSDIKKDNLIESDMCNKETRTYSISLQTHSFSWIHIISLIISLIFTCINFYNSLLTNEIPKELYAFLFFIKNVDLKWIFIIPCSLYVLLSIPYFIISKNREEISDRITIKNYSLYCLLSSICLFIFSLLNILFGVEEKDDNNFKYISEVIYLIILLISFWYRANLYYSSSIIYEGNNIIKRMINCLKIIFCIRKIKQFQSIDYNNDFLLHSLASKNDFMSDEDMAKSFDQSIQSINYKG